MTSWPKLYGLLRAVEYIARNEIPGAFVECGVWGGGSMMATALTRLDEGVKDRNLNLFDSFAGLPEPGPEDVTNRGKVAHETWSELRDGSGGSHWCRAVVDEVRRALSSTGYPDARLHYVAGLIVETIPGHAPDEIALLRQDTDWYESTRHSLVHLFPGLAIGGVLILDDYGYWRGVQKAVGEYLAERKIPLLLDRLDHGGRIAVRVR
jgi:hypothetical protein